MYFIYALHSSSIFSLYRKVHAGIKSIDEIMALLLNVFILLALNVYLN